MPQYVELDSFQEVEEIEARNHIQSDIDITGGRTQTLSPEVATPRGIVRASLRGDAAPSTSPSRCSAISASEEGAPYVAKGLSGSTAEAEDGATGAAVKSNGIGKDTERLEEADVDAFRTPEPQAVLFHGLVTPYSHIPLEPTSSSIQCAQRSVASGSGRRSRAASQDANMCKEIAIAAKATDQEALDPPSPSTEPIAPEPLRLGTEAAGADDCVDDPRAAKKMCRGTSKPKSINDGLHTPQYHSKQLNPDEDQRRFPDQLLGAAEEDAAGSVCAQLGVSCSAPVFLTVPQPGDVVSDSQSSREQDEDELLGSQVRAVGVMSRCHDPGNRFQDAGCPANYFKCHNFAIDVQLGLASQHLSAPWHQDETVAGT